MISALKVSLGSPPHPLREAFLRWQCRVRQIAARERQCRPDDAITPAVTLAGDDAPMGHVITVLNKAPAHSLTPELTHMARRTHDPAERRDKAITFFSATYYQKIHTFSDILTAVFPPNSPGARDLRAAERCRLTFSAYGQGFDLECRIWRLSRRNPLYDATWRHNNLFNPNLSSEAVILGFEPIWGESRQHIEA